MSPIDKARAAACVYLSDRWPWLGAHSGYHRLPETFGDLGRALTITPSEGLLPRFAGKAYSVLRQ